MQPEMPFAFDYKEYIDDIIKEIGLENAEESVLAKIQFELFSKVLDRISTVIMVELGEEHVGPLKKIMEDNPGYDQFDAMMAMVPQIDGIEGKLINSLAELRQEIIDDVNRLDEERKK